MYQPLKLPDLSHVLPAPYQVNGGPIGPYGGLAINRPVYDAFRMKRGGRARSKEMTTVHMNPHEISILEHIQGHAPYNRSGVKEFHHLEELLKNPHILRNSHHHAQHHDDGGIAHEDVEHLRQGGRFGDTTLASIGPHTQHFFNQLSGHQTMNPYTGHPEYWGLGGAIKSIGKAIGTLGKGAVKVFRKTAPHMKQITRQVLPAVLPAAQEYLGNKFGDIGKAAGQYAGNAATNALGPQEGPSNPYSSAVGQALNRGIESYRGGNSASQAFGHGLQTAGGNLGGGMGSAMEGMGRSMGNGHDLGSSLRTGAQSGFNAMGGTQGVKNMASQVAQGFGNGGFGGAKNAARQQINDYRNKMMPQLPPPSNMDYEQQYPMGQYV